MIKKSDFHFDLPEGLIAQSPLRERSASRLLCLDKNTGEINHSQFSEFPKMLKAGDCLVLNNSRVLPARLIGKREQGGAAELVLLRDLGKKRWECLARPGRKLRPGARIFFGEDDCLLEGVVTELSQGGNRIVEFRYEGVFLSILDKLGKMPLPPYIKEELEDKERYQTVYSKDTGSAAAPTAGLHFTQEMLALVAQSGVNIAYLTLHVGLGTFRPVKTENIEDHEMHSEFCIVPPETARLVTRTKEQGGRVVAVGTTSCRTIESFAKEDGSLLEGSCFTDIFIYPGYEFKCVDALLTNFHLPESSLIMLISALAGRENVLSAYDEAVCLEYRFFSFGDAMFIS